MISKQNLEKWVWVILAGNFQRGSYKYEKEQRYGNVKICHGAGVNFSRLSAREDGSEVDIMMAL